MDLTDRDSLAAACSFYSLFRPLRYTSLKGPHVAKAKEKVVPNNILLLFRSYYYLDLKKVISLPDSELTSV